MGRAVDGHGRTLVTLAGGSTEDVDWDELEAACQWWANRGLE